MRDLAVTQDVCLELCLPFWKCPTIGKPLKPLTKVAPPELNNNNSQMGTYRVRDSDALFISHTGTFKMRTNDTLMQFAKVALSVSDYSLSDSETPSSDYDIDSSSSSNTMTGRSGVNSKVKDFFLPIPLTMHCKRKLNTPDLVLSLA